MNQATNGIADDGEAVSSLRLRGNDSIEKAYLLRRSDENQFR
jgi:hypothetical protein